MTGLLAASEASVPAGAAAMLVAVGAVAGALVVGAVYRSARRTVDRPARAGMFLLVAVALGVAAAVAHFGGGR